MSFAKSRLALVLLFLTTLFPTVFKANMSPLDGLTSASSFSPLRQRKCLLIGLLSCQTLATPSASRQSGRRLRFSVGRSQVNPRLFVSFDVTQRSSLRSHRAWIVCQAVSLLESRILMAHQSDGEYPAYPMKDPDNFELDESSSSSDANGDSSSGLPCALPSTSYRNLCQTPTRSPFMRSR